MCNHRVSNLVRSTIAILLAVAATWIAAVDWRATIGQGYAYRLTSIGKALYDVLPDFTGNLVEGLQASGVPWLWDPIGETLLALPLALVLVVLAGLVWLSRRQRRR